MALRIKWTARPLVQAPAARLHSLDDAGPQVSIEIMHKCRCSCVSPVPMTAKKQLIGSTGGMHDSKRSTVCPASMTPGTEMV